MMSKITLKTEKRPTKVSDHAISRAVEKAYGIRSGHKDAHHRGESKGTAASALSQSRKKK